jgi:hypothetical protein
MYGSQPVCGTLTQARAHVVDLEGARTGVLEVPDGVAEGPRFVGVGNAAGSCLMTASDRIWHYKGDAGVSSLSWPLLTLGQ